MMLTIFAIIATVLAFVQNSIMFVFGFKEMAIFAFPLSFIGIFIAEVILIWTGAFFIRRFIKTKREALFIVCSLIILGIAELILPVSYVSNYFKHVQRKSVLNRIELTGKSVEILASEHEIGSRFALKYSLQFPKTGHYLTFPAYIELNNKPRVFGYYFRKLHSEYYDERFMFEPSKSYDFIVVFDSGSKRFDMAQKNANIQICDGKDYFMTCRTIKIEVGTLLKDAVASNPTPTAHEPGVSVDNFWDIAEKNIRLADLKIASAQTKTESPLEFSFAITNRGNKNIKIPDERFSSLINIHYAWEAINEAAKKTQVTPGIYRFGNSVAAGGTQFTFQKKDVISPGEKVLIQDKINFVRFFRPLAPGEYKLHILLFNNYSTDSNIPAQELTASFLIVP
jgi:hypothetical protein